MFLQLQQHRLLPASLYVETHSENRGSNMSAHVLLNLLNELGKRDKLNELAGVTLFKLLNTLFSGKPLNEYFCQQ